MRPKHRNYEYDRYERTDLRQKILQSVNARINMIKSRFAHLIFPNISLSHPSTRKLWLLDNGELRFVFDLLGADTVADGDDDLIFTGCDRAGLEYLCQDQTLT